MAPAKTTKRNAQQVASERPQKKAAKKAAPVRAEHEILLDKVVETLCASGNLPEPCAAMFKATAPHSLGRASDERMPGQIRVVDMIGEALEGILGAKAQTVATSAEASRAFEATREELNSAVAAADDVLAVKAEAVKARDDELCDAERKLAEAKAALTAAKEASRLEGTSHAGREDELSEMKSVIDCFERLRAGAEEDDVEVAHRVEVVHVAAGRLQVESSLVTSLPLALAKKLPDRGPFDDVVFQEVRRVFDQEVNRLNALVEEGLPAAAERAAAVAAVQAHVNVADSAATDCKSAFAAAREERSEQKRVKEDAVEAVRLQEPALIQASLVLEAARTAQDELAKVLETFTQLKERSLKPLPDNGTAIQEAEVAKEVCASVDLVGAAEMGA